jgi:hypothetical protein
MYTIPDVTAVTTPLVALTVAIAVLALLQTPPTTVLVSVMALPVQPVAGPPMVAGTGLIVTSVVAIQVVPEAV